MSGRARIYQGRHYAYIYWTGEPLQVARFEQGGRWKPVCMYGPTFKRRSDAKRWLLARAAGLAEVPRGPKLRRGVRRIPRGGCALYIGGRLFAVVDHVTIETETDERNRRRR